MQVTGDGNMAPPSDQPYVQTATGKYETFGACAYQVLAADTVGTRLEDLRGIQTIRIYYQYTNTAILFSNEVRLFDVWIRQSAPETVEIKINAPRGMDGSQRIASDLWVKMQGCGGARPTAAASSR